MTDNQHHSDLDRVSHQNSFTDLVRGIEERPRGGFLENLVLDPVRSVVEATPYGKAVRGRTNFENHDLNQMLDLVEQTDPEDLESSGKALWDARDAIKSAATELSGHIENVSWVGESGDAFREWGRGLVTSTDQLSDFAGGAGDQITAAAVGLASVRKAMPPRDTRPSHEQKQPHAFPKSEQVDSNGHYAAAVRVEKHRQEAINQMNRLSSYYSVSAEQLKGLQTSAPEFKNMPDVGVPQPVAPPPSRHGGGHTAVSTPTGTAPHGAPIRHAATAPADPVPGHRPVDTGGHTRTPHVPPVGTPHVDVPATVDTATNVDSVGTLPPPATAPAPEHSAPFPQTSGAGGGPGGPVGTGGFPLPMANGPLAKGMGGVKGLGIPGPTAGRTGPSGSGSAGAGRTPGRGPVSQMGRTPPTGQTGQAGQGAKGFTPGGNPSQVGRGVSGGTPRAGGATAPRAGAGTGAGRANGVVGGRPTATGASAKGAGRIPRGTVIGAEGATDARSAAGRPGQRGVFGAPETTGRPAGNTVPGARGRAAGSETVTGRPAARTSESRAERNGMTRGGAGLVRGPGARRKPGDRPDPEGSQRPDYLVEDEETHLPTRPRRDVPPVVNRARAEDA
ncbi:hypothetical protein [Streptomyces similanensis]|uniref:Uncharacterized protein n=1 Tax=Streptomyces similanensis TaxID=1274988 RepID=A0ABP9KA42_9ACTN